MQMNWKNLLSTQRFRTKNGEIIPTVTPSTQEGADALRTDFHIDYDRVVFSGAFRRLGRKTQVHPLAEHDLTHNRLTHSVEVASRLVPQSQKPAVFTDIKRRRTQRHPNL